jgi:hypothetical protein
VWTKTAGGTPCGQHKVEFSFGSRAILGAVRLAYEGPERRTEARPEYENSNIDTSFAGEYEVNALLKGHVNLERELFPQQRFQVELSGVTPTQLIHDLFRAVTLVADIAWARDENTNYPHIRRGRFIIKIDLKVPSNRPSMGGREN